MRRKQNDQSSYHNVFHRTKDAPLTVLVAAKLSTVTLGIIAYNNRNTLFINTHRNLK
jgi:hypothetical protein